ncbi:MAG: hypothetical protein QNI93_12785 [Kiloniellales bacterium]|nr:hypothetical protein [Kiloniellales bacterium]
MRRLPTLSWCRETENREPDCLRSIRRQIARTKRFQRLRGIALICLVGLASGYLGMHFDSIKAMADSGSQIDEVAVTAPGYVMVLDEAREAAAAPPAPSGSQAIDVSADCGPDGPQGTAGCGGAAPAWRSSLAPAADAPAEPSEPLALAMIAVPEIEVPAQDMAAEALPVIRAPLEPVKEPVGQAETAARVHSADAVSNQLAAGTCEAGPDTVAVKAFQTGSRTANFVVIGSYTDPMNALKAYARVEDRWQAQIVHIEVGGRLYRRVLLGPFGQEALAEVRQELAERGVNDTWAFRTNCVAAG